MCNHKPLLNLSIAWKGKTFTGSFPFVNNSKKLNKAKLTMSISEWMFDTALECDGIWNIKANARCGECDEDLLFSVDMLFPMVLELNAMENDVKKAMENVAVSIAEILATFLNTYELAQARAAHAAEYLQNTMKIVPPEPGNYSRNTSRWN